MLALLLLLAAPLLASANMYDVIADFKHVNETQCPHGCGAWTDFDDVAGTWWGNKSNAAAFGSSCAQLANAPGLNKPVPVLDPSGAGGRGAWCFCKSASSGRVAAADGATTPAFGYCLHGEGFPTQINLQIAAPKTVVASFVTFEPTAPVATPVVYIGKSATDLAQATGTAVTHVYETPKGCSGTTGRCWGGNRTYYMHFVVLPDLAPRTRYFYKVKSGGTAATWSAVHSFRSGYSSTDEAQGQPTKVAIFGDMGVYSWNNMGNMLEDTKNEEIDLVIQMGDHCYNIGGDDDRRGDGYMEAYQPVLSQIPWLPIVGNHEFYDGEQLHRYLNQTEGTVVANPQNHALVTGATTTADTALGRLLATGNHHGIGTHGAGAGPATASVPSGTSRYYSTDFGLVHFIALDLNMYWAVDPCGEPCRQSQLAWLKADLEAANKNRDAVPWIVAMSHFPLYCSNCPLPGVDPGDWYTAEECEFQGHDQSCKSTKPRGPQYQAPNRDSGKFMVADFEPLFMEYGVDVYSSGHIHDYEFIYPVFNNTAVQKNFSNPRAPVHLVTGNGGPPSASRFSKIQPWSHEHSTVYSYTRLVAYNSTHMEWIQVANNDSRVLTRLMVTQDKHGAFPIPK